MTADRDLGPLPSAESFRPKPYIQPAPEQLRRDAELAVEDADLLRSKGWPMTNAQLIAERLGRAYLAEHPQPANPLFRKFPDGLTVAELQQLVRDWPKLNEAGEPTDVWIGTGLSLSSPVVEAWPVGLRVTPAGADTADLLLESSAFRAPPGTEYAGPLLPPSGGPT